MVIQIFVDIEIVCLFRIFGSICAEQILRRDKKGVRGKRENGYVMMQTDMQSRK